MSTTNNPSWKKLLAVGKVVPDISCGGPSVGVLGVPVADRPGACALYCAVGVVHSVHGGAVLVVVIGYQ